MILTALLLLSASVLQAEIAVYVSLGQPAKTSIVDDPEPFGHSWSPIGPGNPQKFVLNPTGDIDGDGPASVSFAPGTSLPSAVWADNTASGFDIVISRFDGSQWSDEVVVSDEAADELDPTLIIDPIDGSHHLVYWIADAAPRILYRSAPADLSSWSAPIQVSDLTDIAVRPSLSLFEGQLYVVYELHSSGLGLAPRQIAVAQWDGVAFTSEIVATTQYAEANWPTIHSTQSRLWFEWIDSGSEVAWTRRLPAAPWETIDTVGYQNSQQLFHAAGAVRTLAQE